MGNIFSQIGQAFVQAIPTVVFVGLLVFILRRLFFQPVAAVMKERDRQSKGAVERARERMALAEKRAADYEAVWQKARSEIYALREQDQRSALAAREEAIRQARGQAEASVKDAQKALAAEASAVQAELTRSTQALASQIVSAILDGPDGARPSGVSH